MRPICSEITKNNAVNSFEFFPFFDKDSLHFRKGDPSAPPLWRVSILLTKNVAFDNVIDHVGNRDKEYWLDIKNSRFDQ